MANLALGISTVKSRLVEAEKLANSVSGFFDEVVVVVQDSMVSETKSVGNVRFIFRTDRGLSKSRNLLLNNVSADWLWICDDDVSISNFHVDLVRDYLRKNSDSVNVFAGRIGCLDGVGCFKNYKYRWFRPMLFAQVSSIELVVNAKWVLDKGLFFDEKFGLGSNYPIAEEPIFAADIVRAGGKICDIPYEIVRHPCSQAGLHGARSWSDTNIALSRGLAAKRIGGWRGVVVLLFWIYSSLFRGSGGVRILLAGYFSRTR